MSREDVEIVRSMCEAFACGDWAEGARPLHAEVEWDTTTMGVWLEAEVLHGRDSVLDFFRRFLGTWDEYHAQFEDYRPLPRIPGSRVGAPGRRGGLSHVWQVGHQ